jgi:hypothetical protein
MKRSSVLSLLKGVISVIVCIRCAKSRLVGLEKLMAVEEGAVNLRCRQARSRRLHNSRPKNKTPLRRGCTYPYIEDRAITAPQPDFSVLAKSCHVHSVFAADAH